MASLNTIVVTIMANGQQYISSLKSMASQTQTAAGQMQKGMTGVGNSTKSAASSTALLTEKLKGLGLGVLGNIARFTGYFVAVGALKNAIGNVVEEIRNFDAQMRNIQSITLDTDEATTTLAKDLLKFVLAGDSAGQSAGKIAENMYQIVQAGYDAADALKIAQVAAVGASAGQTDAAIAGKALVSILQAYKQPVENADMIMSHLFTIVDKGVITFGELAGGLGYVVPSAAALGVTLSELGSGIELLTRQGQLPTRTMTNLNAMLTALLKPSTKLSDAIEEIGYSSGAAMIEQLGLVGTIAALGKAAGVTDTELADLASSGRDLNEIVDEGAYLNAEASSTLAQWFGTVRAIRAVLPLAANGGREFNAMLNEHNLMALTGKRHLLALEQQQKSLNYQVTALSANFAALFTILASLVLPSIISLLKSVNELFKKLVVVNEVTGETMFLWEKYPGVLKKVTSVLEFLATLIGLRLFIALVSIIRPFLNIISVASAIIKLVNPWVLLATIIIALLKHFGLFDDIVRKLEETFHRIATKATPILLRAFEMLSTRGGAAFSKLIGMIRNFAQWFMQGFSGSGWSKSSKGIDQFAMKLGQKAKSIKETIQGVIKTVERLAHMFSLGFKGLEAKGFSEWEMRAYQAGKKIKDIFTWVMEVGIPNAIDIAKYAWTAFAAKIINDAKNVFNFLKGLAQSDVAKELFASFMEGLRLIGDAVNWFATVAVPAIVNALQQFSNSDAGRFIGKLVGWLIEARIVAFLLVGAFIALTSPIGLIVVGILALITAIGFVNRHWDEFLAKVHEVWDGLPGIVKFALESLKLHFETVIGLIKNVVVIGFQFIVGTITNAITMIRGIWNIVAGVWTGDWQRVWDGIKLVISGAWSQIKLIIETGVALLKAVLAAAWNFIKGEAGLVWDQIKEKVRQVWSDITSAITNGINDALTTVKSFPGIFAEEIGKIADKITESVGKIIEAGKGIGSGLVEGIAQGIGGISSKIDQMSNIIFQAIKASMNAALRSAHETIKFGFDGLSVGGKQVIPPVNFAFPLFQFAKGVRDFMGGMALLGENGPELAFLPSGTSVATAPKTSRIMDNMTSGGQRGGRGDVYAEFNVSTDVDSILEKLHQKVEELGRQLRSRSVHAGSPLNGRLG